MHEQNTFMTIAVNQSKVAMAFFLEGEVVDWEISEKASKSPKEARHYIRHWLSFYCPDLVITEKLDENFQKGKAAKTIIQHVQAEIELSHIPHQQVPKKQPYANKYVMAEVLGERFPILASYVPTPRKVWMPEPRNAILFDAVALGVFSGLL